MSTRIEIEVEEIHAFATSRGGACLDHGELHETAIMRWRCGKEHEFEASFKLLRQGGYWCPDCFPSVSDTSGWDYDATAAVDPLLARFHGPGRR
jgi:hypothetical protein